MFVSAFDLHSTQIQIISFSLKLTGSPPESQWLEDVSFLLGFGPIFGGKKLAVNLNVRVM